MNTPFSILISVYEKERPDQLRQSLDSIFSQTLRADEVVLVKDGPLYDELNDVVDDYAARYPELKVLPLPTNVGLGKALNEGIALCTHDIVARMDTDDVAKPYRMERQIRFMEEHPEVDVLGSWLEEFRDDIDHIVSVKSVPMTHDELYAYGKWRNPINHPTVVMRKSAVERAGGYQPCPQFEDYCLWVRMMQSGARFHNLQESLVYFRMSDSMLQRRKGWKYISREFHAWRLFRQTGYINTWQMCCSVLIRLLVRIMPNMLFSYIYTHHLHRQAEMRGN